MTSNRTTTEGRAFTKKLHIRIYVDIVFVLLGIAAFIALWMLKDGRMIVDEHNAVFLAGFYTGASVGLIVRGVREAVLTIRALRDDTIFTQKLIAANDERNQFLNMKAYQMSAYAMFFALLAGCFVAGVVDFMVFRTLIVCLGGFSFILVGARLIVKRMY